MVGGTGEKTTKIKYRDGLAGRQLNREQWFLVGLVPSDFWVVRIGQLRSEQLFLVGCVCSSKGSAGAGLHAAATSSTSSSRGLEAKGGKPLEVYGGTSRILGKGKHQEVEPCYTPCATVTSKEDPVIPFKAL